MKRKVLLMGRSGSGKTSMRSIIFDNVVARDTKRLGATIDVDTSQIRFLGDLQLDLWDCGGQESFMDQYLDARRDTIFKQVHTLIYIFDVVSTSPTDMVYFLDILGALRAGSGPSGTPSSDASVESGSSGPMVHVLIHKMDLINPDKRQATFNQRAQEVRQKCAAAGLESVRVFPTSIWDETLYSAWSDIVSTLNPHVAALSTYLSRLAELCSATEVVLFERTTMLVISQSSRSESNLDAADQHGEHFVSLPSDWPEDRFAKISQAIKLFRVGCKRLKSEFQTMEVKQHSYTAIFDVFTPKTFILLVSTSDQLDDTAAVKAVIDKARPVFANLPGVSIGGR